jgi:hypothetical protein
MFHYDFYNLSPFLTASGVIGTVFLSWFLYNNPVITIVGSGLGGWQDVIGLDFFSFRETFWLLTKQTQKYKRKFKRLGTELVGNISIDRANSGIIKNSLINHGVKYRERVPGSLIFLGWNY